ncbi:MAG: FGGY family carbohydrate kinase [Christensenella sp.]|nr:FGGY family carbohydrate kinase [Christensenella sp.]
MLDKKTMVALDCGNSSFRIVIGEYKDGKLGTKVVKQIPNSIIRLGDYEYWDILYILNEFKSVLKEIVISGTKIDSIGICTWGIDFALFDPEGNMLSNALCYRNPIGKEYLSRLNEEDRRKMFLNTGILCDKINSVFMLAGIKEKFNGVFAAADKLLMIPDILNYFLTGKMVNEPSEFSTTQIMDVRTKEISGEICKMYGLDKGLFSEIGKHGEKIGDVRDYILQEIGADYSIPVVCVPSHDTASAIAAIPAKEKSFGFISCGTWSLIGTELDEPIINDSIADAGLTNEVGAFEKITLLKNSAGMFIANMLQKEYRLACGRNVSWEEISKMTEACAAKTVFDLNDIRFFNPESMSREIWEYLIETKQVSGENVMWDVLFRAFYESLACEYAVTINNIESITGNSFEKIYIVGGGTASKTLLNLVAKHTGKTVVACYGESTSMGNIAVQLKYFYRDIDLYRIREIIAASYKTEELSCRKEDWEILARFQELNH